MKTSALVLGLASVTACASAQPPVGTGAPAASPPAASAVGRAASAAVPEEPARAAFFDTLAKNDEPSALAMLAGTPALAEARTPRGTSAYFAALGRVVGNGFVRPQDNRIARAILALHPTLDAFDAAAAGDSARVEREIASDPAFVSRVHRLGWTPLHFAAFGGQVGMVELLVARGSVVDAVAKNHFANTPLQVALLTRQGEAARALLAHGADVRFRQAEGVTALHEAAQSGDLDVVRMLLDAGADPTARTGILDDGQSGLTPLDMARKAGHGDVAALLESKTKT